MLLGSGIAPLFGAMAAWPWGGTRGISRDECPCLMCRLDGYLIGCGVDVAGGIGDAVSPDYGVRGRDAAALACERIENAAAQRH